MMSKKLRSLLFFSTISLFSCNHCLADHAHIHGQAQMTLVLDEKQLFVTLTITAHDLIGFENLPQTVNEKAMVNNAIAKLKQTEQWLTIENGGCIKIQEEINNPFLTNQVDDMDFSLSVGLACDSPKQIKTATIRIHQQFADISETEVQWIVGDKQGFNKANKNKETISFE